MVRAWTVWMVTGLVAGGCVSGEQSPLRARLGINARQVMGPSVPSLARATRPMKADAEPLASAGTLSMQLTARALGHLFIGGEAEAGTLLGRDGSNYAGTYGVIGAETGAARVWLSLELAAGRRWLRADLETPDAGAWMLEPRVRTLVLVTPQISFGAVLGANAMPDEHGWNAGLFVGFGSHVLDGALE